jgi:hypothetical protein
VVGVLAIDETDARRGEGAIQSTGNLASDAFAMIRNWCGSDAKMTGMS